MLQINVPKNCNSCYYDTYCRNNDCVGCEMCDNDGNCLCTDFILSDLRNCPYYKPNYRDTMFSKFVGRKRG